ncbi:putative Ig domain-containing protein [Deinococcus pimensis]|uniref:putative Ig domain-containing protein n=1 Tax=Deinococcus pimensis TaxID=309888 RepID=UPI00146FB229|nr:putative Ig domain-containing protein [Deinococcus pimensis]
MKRSTLLLSALLAVGFVACGTQSGVPEAPSNASTPTPATTSTTTPTPETGKTTPTPAAPVTANLATTAEPTFITLSFEDVGNADVRTGVDVSSGVTSQAVSKATSPYTVTTKAKGIIDDGNYRILWARYELQNTSTDVTLTNATMLGINRTSYLNSNYTALSNPVFDNGTPSTDPAVVRSIVPVLGVPDPDLTKAQGATSDYVAYDEPDVAPVLTTLQTTLPTNGYQTVFPYGFTYRNKATGSRSIKPGETGEVVVAFRLPRSTISGQDIYSFSWNSTLVTDSEYRVTRGVQEGQGAGSTGPVIARAQALKQPKVNVVLVGQDKDTSLDCSAGGTIATTCTPVRLPNLRVSGPAGGTLTSLLAPPVLALQDKSVSEMGTIVFDLTSLTTSPNKSPITRYELLTPVSGATLNEKTGAFSFTAGAQQAGNVSLQFRVTNGDGSSDTKSMTLAVNDVTVPVLTTATTIAGKEGEAVTSPISARDDDDDTLTYSITNTPNKRALPDNLTINAKSGALSFIPGYDQAGTYYARVTVTDGNNPVSADVQINVADANRSPVLTNLSDRSVAEGSPLSIPLSASDADVGVDDDVLTYSANLMVGGVAQDLPKNASINASTGAFSWTPDYDQSNASPYTIRFTVTDKKGATNSRTISITVTDTNRAPTLSVTDVNGNAVPTTATIGENSSLTFAYTGGDQDNDQVTYSASVLNTSGTVVQTLTSSTLNGKSVFSWTPTYNQSGAYTLRISANDGRNLSNSVTTVPIAVTVTDMNRAPTITSPENKTVAEKGTLSFTLVASDEDVLPRAQGGDGDKLTYSANLLVNNGLQALPANASIDADTGAFLWTPDYNQSGTYTVRFTVKDSKNAANSTATQDITITVNDTNRAPTLSVTDVNGNAVPASVSVAEGSALTFAYSGSDPDGDSVTYSASVSNAAGTVIYNLGSSVVNGKNVFSWTPKYTDASGAAYTYRVTVTDSKKLAANSDVAVTVTEAPMPVLTTTEISVSNGNNPTAKNVSAMLPNYIIYFYSDNGCATSLGSVNIDSNGNFSKSFANGTKVYARIQAFDKTSLSPCSARLN